MTGGACLCCKPEVRYRKKTVQGTVVLGLERAQLWTGVSWYWTFVHPHPPCEQVIATFHLIQASLHLQRTSAVPLREGQLLGGGGHRAQAQNTLPDWWWPSRNSSSSSISDFLRPGARERASQRPGATGLSPCLQELRWRSLFAQGSHSFLGTD